MERRIVVVFKKLLYEPLIKELGLPKKKVLNSIDNLLSAITSGRITVRRGRWRGKFNAQLSKELKELGAVWESDHFHLPVAELPAELRAAIALSETRFVEKLERIDAKLQKILPEEIADKIKTADLFDKSLWKIDRELGKTLKNISVLPKLTPEVVKRLSDDWQNNMDLWIKDFTEKEIKSLRKAMLANIMSGNRYEDMISTIMRSYDVTKNKARFLARQETSLAMTSFKQTRYQDAGVNEYKWTCVSGTKLHPVRPSHKILDGKVFRWDDPPITTPPNQKTRRNNPGQDYNCRCYARPIVRFKK